MNMTPQRKTWIGWAVVVCAMTPAFALLACNVEEEAARRQQTCGAETGCQEAVEQVATHTRDVVAVAAAQASGIDIPPFRARCSEGGQIGVSGEVDGAPPHIDYDLALDFQDCHVDNAEDDLRVSGAADVASDVDLEGRGDYFLESNALKVQGAVSGVPVAFTCPVELTVHNDGLAQTYKGTACGLPVSGTLPS